jgi:hypothetical protein
VLETCLAEEATPDNLNLYLPKLRRIITNFLRGLRSKQSIGANGHAHPASVPPQTQQSQHVHQSDDDMLSHESSEPSVAHSTVSTSLNSIRRKLYKLYKKLRPTPPIQNAPIPAPVECHSLVDRPVSPPPQPSVAVLIEETPATPSDSQHPPTETPASAVASTPAPLKKSDVRKRRASKRFSTNEIRQMTADDVEELRELERSRKRSKRRSREATRSSRKQGPLAVVIEVDEPIERSSRKQGPLAVVIEVDEPVERSSRKQGSLTVVIEVDEPVELDGSAQSTSSILQAPSPTIEVEAARPVPPLPSLLDITRSRLPPKMGEGTDELPVSEVARPTVFSCFLQVGREDKKVTIESGMSFASLRALFVEKFSYNPGMKNFPTIYIRDPSGGARYELEDIEEVKEKCLLSLNIEYESACYL